MMAEYIIPELIIDGQIIPSVMPPEKYQQIKLAIAERALGTKEAIDQIVDDAYIAVPEEEGGLGADSLAVIEIIMEVEEILGVTIPDDQAELVGRVYHVAHLHNVRAAEEAMPGVLGKWMTMRNREIDDYMAEHGKTRKKR